METPGGTQAQLLVDYVTPTAADADLARSSGTTLAQTLRDRPAELTLQVGTPESGEPVRVALPAAIGRVLVTILGEMAQGHRVAVSTQEEEVSTSEAAELLNVSRPFVVKLIDSGQLPSRMVGTHRRVLLKDVLTYKRAHRARARQTLDNITAESQELGLYDLE